MNPRLQSIVDGDVAQTLTLIPDQDLAHVVDCWFLAVRLNECWLVQEMLDRWPGLVQVWDEQGLTAIHQVVHERLAIVLHPPGVPAVLVDLDDLQTVDDLIEDLTLGAEFVQPGLALLRTL